MSYFAQAGALLIEVVMSLIAALFLLRLALPMVGANFYNPICQFIYRTTHGVIAPLRRALPPVGRFETSAAIVAWAVVMLKTWLVMALGGRMLGLLPTLVLGLADLLGLLLSIAFWLILVRAILSFFAPSQPHPALPLIGQLTEPLLAPFRRLLPAAGGLDFSPLLAMLTLLIARVLLVAPLTDFGLMLARQGL
ncbi:MAG: YggT family protein [Aquimonas sp.]|nr:YggT family protein [Aquimonas sp.]